MNYPSYSYEDGREKLRDKGLLNEVHEVADEVDALKDKEAKSVAESYGWETGKQVIGRFDWHFDAYKEGVAIEFERGHQTKARWAWMKFLMAWDQEIANQLGQTEVNVGVLMLWQGSGGASVKRCANELDSEVFRGIMPFFDVPMYIIGVRE